MNPQLVIKDCKVLFNQTDAHMCAYMYTYVCLYVHIRVLMYTFTRFKKQVECILTQYVQHFWIQL